IVPGSQTQQPPPSWLQILDYLSCAKPGSYWLGPYRQNPTEYVVHSMGGFVARAAVVHPNLRKLVVETGITLSTPHQSPPAAIIGSLLRVHRLAMEKG
ncbi:GPI inositol-deacylase isoform X1, partial [Tanacetum coccineum]